MPSDPTTNPFVRRLLDIYNSRRTDAFDALLTEDCVLVRNGEEARGREAFKEVIGDVYRAFPDVEYRIDGAVTEGDTVAIRWEARGTHRGPYLGVEPTGREIRYDGITFLEMRGDRIARAWVTANLLALWHSLIEAAQARPPVQPGLH